MGHDHFAVDNGFSVDIERTGNLCEALSPVQSVTGPASSLTSIDIWCPDPLERPRMASLAMSASVRAASSCRLPWCGVPCPLRQGRSGHPLAYQSSSVPSGAAFPHGKPGDRKNVLNARRPPLLAALLLGFGPTARAALAFEHADRLSGLRIHHLADDHWLSAAFTCRMFPRLGA